MADSKLSRTAGTPSSNRKFTISLWVKKLGLEADQMLVSTFTDANNRTQLAFNDSDQLDLIGKVSGSNILRLKTNRVFRDTAAWYHLLVAVDTTQSAEADRAKLYVNGVQETSFHTSTIPSVNTDLDLAGTHYIGSYQGSSLYFDGKMAHVHFTDNYAYTNTDFGSVDSTSGIWKIKTGSAANYGTNGFFLKFENSGAMGTDSSGNTNTFTAAGNLKQGIDTPSINWCTTSGLHQHNISNGTFSTTYTGSRFVTNTSSQAMMGIQTFPALKKGKWYAEFKLIAEGSGESICGVMNSIDDMQQGSSGFSSSRGYGVASNGDAKFGGSAKGSGNWSQTYAVNDIISVALDMDNYRVYFAKNGQYADGSGNWDEAFTGSPAYLSLSNAVNKDAYVFAGGDKSTSAATTWEVNYGDGFFGITAVASANADGNSQGKFEYAVPSGYYALNTKNLNTYG